MTTQLSLSSMKKEREDEERKSVLNQSTTETKQRDKSKTKIILHEDSSK